MIENEIKVEAGRPWAPFEPIDAARRLGGRMLDAWGWGPRESPFRVLLQTPAMTVRAYSEPTSQGPVVLIVPAPIKRAYIWDLMPGASAVQQFLRGGARVYLIQWEAPGAREQTLGLADYANRLILDSLRAIQGEAGRDRIILAGHSLGGTFAAIFSALHPEAVRGLILMGAPVHFGPRVDALSALVAQSPSWHGNKMRSLRSNRVTPVRQAQAPLLCTSCNLVSR